MDVEHFRQLADLLDDGIIYLDAEGRIHDVNVAGAALLQRKRSELQGRDIRDFVTGPLDQTGEFLKRCSCSRQFSPGTLTFQLPKNQIIICRSDGAATSDKAGGLFIRIRERIRADHSFQLLNRERQIERLAYEIELRKTAEALLRNEREWFRTTLASIGDAVIATDAKGNVTFTNVVAEQLTGWSPEESLGKPLPVIFNIVHEETRKAADNPVFRSIKEGAIVGLANHTILISKDGIEKAIDDSAAPIRGVDGEIIGAVLVFRDVTERRESEIATIRAALSKAESANRAKDEWISILSHELRTPLTPILGWTRLIRTLRMESKESQRGLEIIERNVHAQMRIVEDLLDVSRMVSGKLTLDFQPLDMREVIQLAVEGIMSVATAKGVRLDYIRAADPAPVTGDASRLQQVVWNILSNAIKFTEKGGRVVAVVRREKEHVEFEVTDSGIGMSKDSIPLLFKRFQQEDASTTRQFGGLGLGLSIVRHIVDLHHGSVLAHSDGKGKGATFIVNLPLLQNYESPSADKLSVVDSLPQLNGMRLLVVDDEEDTLEFVIFAMQQFGAVVEGAKSAKQALEVLKNRKMDALISDLGMPHEDGFYLIERIRAMGLTIPAIALTAFARDEDRHRVLSAGFQTHMSKPAEPKVLAEALLRIMKN